MRFKENLKTIDSALYKVSKLRGVEFNWAKFDSEGNMLEDLGRRDIGVIAQEVKEYFPEMVKMGSDGYYSVRYDYLLPIIVEAIQNQNDILIESERKLELVETRLKEKGLI